nr:DNA alkylation repair protein [bacterium]
MTGARMEKAIVEAFSAHRDPARAEGMSAYMKHRFPFMGISSPERRRLAQVALAGLPPPTDDDLLEFARACWERPEREYQYAAIDQLRKATKRLGEEFLTELRWMIVTKPWWDSCDPLSGTVVGGIVKRFPGSASVMEEWIADEDLWLRRAALLHQLKWKEDCDQERLFRFCRQTMEEKDFFIRKAIGWALRQHARVAPAEVSRYLTANRGRLSGLSFREAAKHLRLT